ncbi:MAG: RluA family pseudouridine synthase [Myxococcales bacterium]|nr:RluA family pseudouridine synthase [Myxococcales bacterium]
MNYKVSQRMNDQEVLDRIIYRDAMILALNKPSGIPVHAANGGRHNLEQYFHLLQFGLPQKPHLAHRLDLGTSGCLVLARHAQSARRLLQLFSEGLVKKSYVAMVHGVVLADEGRIDVALSKQSPEKKHWWMKADVNGKFNALTEFSVIERYHDKTLLKLTPHTGRTHQLRVHCAYLGHPIIGDYIYGVDKEAERQKKLHLHAESIELPLYPKKEIIKINAPLPSHMSN